MILGFLIHTKKRALHLDCLRIKRDDEQQTEQGGSSLWWLLLGEPSLHAVSEALILTRSVHFQSQHSQSRRASRRVGAMVDSIPKLACCCYCPLADFPARPGPSSALTFLVIIPRGSDVRQIQVKNLSAVQERRRQWHPTPVLLPGKSHGRRNLVDCSPWGRWGSYTTEWLHFHFLLSCIGEGNGNPLQCSCLEKPRDGGAWWAAVYGAAQSRTRLKRLSSSSSSSAGDLGLICGSGRSPGERNGTPLQYSCLENPMDRGAWQATVHGVAKSQTWLSDEHFHFLSNAGVGVPQDTILTAEDPEERAASNTIAHLSPRLCFSLVWGLRYFALVKAKVYVQVRHGWHLARVSSSEAAPEHLLMWSGRKVDRAQGRACSSSLSYT